LCLLFYSHRIWNILIYLIWPYWCNKLRTYFKVRSLRDKIICEQLKGKFLTCLLDKEENFDKSGQTRNNCLFNWIKCDCLLLSVQNLDLRMNKNLFTFHISHFKSHIFFHLIHNCYQNINLALLSSRKRKWRKDWLMQI